MAEGGERMQLRSMVDKNKEDNWNEGATHHDGERPEDTETITPATTNPTHKWSDGLDDIDRAVRISTRKVRKFWYIPEWSTGDSDKCTQAEEVFQNSTFEICIDNGKMYTYTDPKVDTGVGLEPDIDKLEDHFKEHTKEIEFKHQMERIPLMERTTPTTEVIPLREFENNIGKFFKLCRMYGEASCELSQQSLGSEEETAKAYDALQPYISDILEQIEKGQALFRIEREVRNHKGRGRLCIPYTTPKEKLITNAKQLKEFIEAVDEDLTSVIESVRAQEEEFENREQARKEEEARQEQQRRNARPTGLSYQTVTSTPLRTQAPYPTASHNRQTNRGVLFDPNPTRHSYAHTGDSNNNNDYEQLSGDSMSQDTDMNDRISPTDERDTNGERRSDWHQNQATGYGTRTDRTNWSYRFPKRTFAISTEKCNQMLPMWRTRTHPYRVSCTRGILQQL